MRKATIFVCALAFTAALLSSCRSHGSCPAYGSQQHSAPAAERSI